jgi:hypothetical protein
METTLTTVEALMSCQGASLREGFATDEKWPFPGGDERVCVPADGTDNQKT